MDLGSGQVGKGQLHPALMAGGGWIPHLEPPHSPCSSASSQGVSHFPLVFIPAFPLVKSKSRSAPHNSHGTRDQKAKKGNKKKPKGYTKHPKPHPALIFTPGPSPEPTAAQGRLSPGFAFLGNHRAPVSRKPALPPAKNNPPSCCLMSPSPWRQCFLAGRSTGGEAARRLRVFAPR